MSVLGLRAIESISFLSDDYLASTMLETIYSNLLLTLISRLLHHADLRHLSVDLLTSLPHVPLSVIDFVHTTMQHGNKAHQGGSHHKTAGTFIVTFYCSDDR